LRGGLIYKLKLGGDRWLVSIVLPTAAWRDDTEGNGERPGRWFDHYVELFEAEPDDRVLVPDAGIWSMAGLVAGTLARTQGFAATQRQECLNDALILLTAARAGLPVLTANRAEFELIQQVAGTESFVHY